jgi:hypothetical protein
MFLYGWNQYLWPLILLRDQDLYVVQWGVQSLAESSEVGVRFRTYDDGGHPHKPAALEYLLDFATSIHLVGSRSPVTNNPNLTR